MHSLLRDGVLAGPCSCTRSWSRQGETVASIAIRGGRNSIRLHYRHQGVGETEWRSVDEEIGIEWRDNRYGGFTPYFVCPRCQRSVWRLYLHGGHNTCRHCAKLTYESRRSRSYDRLAETVHRLRMKLGGEPGFDNAIAEKPKGMHRKTYDLMCKRIWIEWRRVRLRAAEAAHRLAHAFDRASDSTAKTRTLTRAGVTDHTAGRQTSIDKILSETSSEDAASLAAARAGIDHVESVLRVIDAGEGLEATLVRLDEGMRDWWTEALDATDDDGRPSYEASAAGLAKFLRLEGVPWRRSWLRANEARPTIRTQAIGESLDPARVGQLWEMEARLDRQFEKALSMLIRLQEMRT